MLRNFLLPALAAATLAGCVTDYAYRGGNGGDYYYGQPRVEYRYNDPYGYFGAYGYGSYAPGYYYDRFGRLVYGNPYGYYGYPYGQGGWWYRPRPPHGHGGDHGGQPHDDDADRNDRKPPWRDLGRGPRQQQRMAGEDGEDLRPRVRRQSIQSPMTPSPQREQRIAPAPVPRMRSDEPRGSRMGGIIRSAKGTAPAADE